MGSIRSLIDSAHEEAKMDGPEAPGPLNFPIAPADERQPESGDPRAHAAPPPPRIPTSDLPIGDTEDWWRTFMVTPTPRLPQGLAVHPYRTFLHAMGESDHQKGKPTSTPTKLPAVENPEDLERQIVDEIETLERWALDNQREAKHETIAFWFIKTPALIVSAGAGITSYYEWKAAAIAIGALASLCVLIDALRPAGQLRNVHKRAVHDLRRLQDTMYFRWKIGKLEKVSLSQLTANILKDALEERRRIGDYIRDTEISLGAGSTTPSQASTSAPVPSTPAPPLGTSAPSP